MKLIIVTLMTVFALGAEAGFLKDILPIIIGDGRGPSRPAPYPGNPSYGGGYFCQYEDEGHEEHFSAHGSCRECLRKHGECVETCSSVTVQCRVEGRDYYGNLVSFIGVGRDRWAAENDGIRACQYNRVSNCYAVGCNQRKDIVSRRSCR